VPLLLVGAGKGVAGVLVRPGIGALELTSKLAYGLSLACLGKQGIVGTVQRRVRPPGAAAPDDEDAQLTASKLYSSDECVAFQCAHASQLQESSSLYLPSIHKKKEIVSGLGRRAALHGRELMCRRNLQCCELTVLLEASRGDAPHLMGVADVAASHAGVRGTATGARGSGGGAAAGL